MRLMHCTLLVNTFGKFVLRAKAVLWVQNWTEQPHPYVTFDLLTMSLGPPCKLPAVSD